MEKYSVIAIIPPNSDPPPVNQAEHDIEFIFVRDEDEFERVKHRSSVIFLEDFRSRLFSKIDLSGVSWIHTAAVGVDALLTPSVVDSSIIVTNTRGVCERPIAEWVLGTILMFAKDLRGTVEFQQEAAWVHKETLPIQDRKAVVLGPGLVGQEIALLLRAVGMEVSVVGRTPRIHEVLGEIAGPEDLRRVLGESDDVVLALPLTPVTRGYFNKTKIKMMKRGAHLVNIGRGAVLPEADLLEALDAGQIAAASLDVFEVEPLPPQHPFWSRRDVLVSPHASGDLVGSRSDVVSHFLANHERWIKGLALNNVLDLEQLGTL